MKLAVVYHSKSGNTRQMAEAIVRGMNSVEGVQAKAFSIDAVEEQWMLESKCIIAGSPIYLASVSGEMKTWLEGPCKKYKLAGKIGGAFATADYIHGGGELGIRTILDHMMVLGMLTFSGGGSFGKPVIHLGPVAIGGHLEKSEETFEIYGKRMAMKTVELFGDHTEGVK